MNFSGICEMSELFPNDIVDLLKEDMVKHIEPFFWRNYSSYLYLIILSLWEAEEGWAVSWKSWVTNQEWI